MIHFPVDWFPGECECTYPCCVSDSFIIISDSLKQKADCDEPNRGFIFPMQKEA
jgi:hypothetical protein